MPQLQTILFVLFLLLASFFSLADNSKLVLSYDGFFDRMDDLNEPEYTGIKLAFYFKNKDNNQACKILSARLQTQLKQQDVYFLEDGEVLLPFDEQLDMDKAKLVIEHQERSPCGLDMRIESAQLFRSVIKTQHTLELINKFDLALDELAGMMAFLTPEVAGITFLADKSDKLVLLDPSLGKCNPLGCTILKDRIKELKSEIVFNYAPKKAVPFIR